MKKEVNYFWKVLAKNYVGESLWSSSINQFYLRSDAIHEFPLMPLSIGNKWFYREIDGTSTVFYQRECVADTIINGKNYTIMTMRRDGELRGPQYWRSDSLVVESYGFDTLSGSLRDFRYYDTTIVEDTSFSSGYYYITVDPSNTEYWGKLRKMQKWEYTWSSDSRTSKNIVEGIGIVRERRSFFGIIVIDVIGELTGAIIDGIVYGDTTTQLTHINQNPETGDQVPEGIVLYQNYPNPFNASTEISYDLPYSGRGGYHDL